MDFDPYHELLSIPPHSQPPNHFQLLGVPFGECNREVISNAAERQMSFLRKVSGEHTARAQEILNEIASAKLVLLDESARKDYMESFQRPPAVSRVSQFDPSSRVLLIGSSSGCDVVVRGKSVSRTHCRFIQCDDGQFAVEDCNSRNGTYVNNTKITCRVTVKQIDLITLGGLRRFAWPDVWFSDDEPFARFVGRHPSNDIVLSDISVSNFHARIIIDGDQYQIEELSSKNGVVVNWKQISARTSVSQNDPITIGSISDTIGGLLARAGPSAENS